MTANQLGKVAYQIHYHAMNQGREVWPWEDLPTVTQQHWVRIALAVAEAAETGETTTATEDSPINAEYDEAQATRHSTLEAVEHNVS